MRIRANKQFHGFMLYVCLGAILLATHPASAQMFHPEGQSIKRSGFRAILNKITISGSLGYARTFYGHKLTNHNLIEREGQLFIAPKESSTQLGDTLLVYTNWFNRPQSAGLVIQEGDKIYYANSTKLGFRGGANGIPFTFSLHYDYKKFKAGLGLTAEWHMMRPFKPIHFKDSIPGFTAEFNSALFMRYFVVLGYRYHEYRNFTFNADVKIGMIRNSKKFDRANMTGGFFVSLGLPVEYVFSEYLRVFARPAFEYKAYQLNLPEVGSAIKHNYSSAFIEIGIRFNYPEIPRCKVDGCRTQLKHIHGGAEFRGQPIHKKQNPKIGENYPQLDKYKWKNKNKLSPF